MLIRNSYKGCDRLYWEPEDFEQEAPLATFEYQGAIYNLEFDGRVDDLIWNHLRNKNCSTLDIAELYETVPHIERLSANLKAGEKISISLGSGKKWVASRNSSIHGVSIVLRSGIGQTATLATDPDDRIQRLTLRTDGQGITHEIRAKLRSPGQIEPVAEAVTVYRP